MMELPEVAATWSEMEIVTSASNPEPIAYLLLAVLNSDRNYRREPPGCCQ